MTYRTCEIPVPGYYLKDVAYLDLETEKVPTRPGFRIRTGEPLGRRWSAFLAGVASGGVIRIVERTGDEESFLSGVRMAIGPADTVVYRATRKFDEMILKGRFTYARRGPEEVPFFPAMPDAEELTWDCRRPDPTGYWETGRSRELDSRYVSGTYRFDPGLVRIHLLRDVAELIGAYGEPDVTCHDWLVRILTEMDFAESLLVDAA